MPHRHRTGVTAGKNALESALRESEAKYQRLIDGLRGEYFFFRHDASGVFTYVSATVQDILGYTPQQYRVHYADTLTAAPVNKAVIERTQRGLSGIRQPPYEIEVFHKDGSVRHLAIFESPVTDEQGQTVAIEGIAHDITQRKRDAENLSLTEAVFNCTHEGIVVTDAQGIILRINPAAETITGYRADELVGKNMRMNKSDRHDREFYQSMWKSITETGFWQGEIWNRRKSGEIYPEWLTISAATFSQRGTHYIGIFTDISQGNGRSATDIEHLAHYDALTDLPNRLLLLSHLAHAVERAKRNSLRGAVLFLDLDRFKNVNDSLGHAAGDQLLVLASQRMRGRLREADFLARLGGDEFVIVLEDITNPTDAADVAQALVNALSQSFHLAGEHEVYVGCSIGISIFPDDGEKADELIQHADNALYLAKGSGRGTYSFYLESLTRQANERLSMEALLRRGLERDEFELYYQPLVSVKHNRLVGVEALIRWHCSRRSEIVLPNSFIPLAEETGIIAPLGDWVLRTACAQMKNWLNDGLPLQTISINVSPRQFHRPDFVEQVRNTLTRYAVPPSCLELEITESTLLKDAQDTQHKLAALKTLGVHLSIDDFGTGYSSLAYLSRFEIDKLKIDQSFISGIPRDPTNREIAATIIGLARNLNVQSVAEGVETREQLDFLTQNGCDLYQGYLYSRPVPAAVITELLGKHRQDPAHWNYTI